MALLEFKPKSSLRDLINVSFLGVICSLFLHVGHEVAEPSTMSWGSCCLCLHADVDCLCWILPCQHGLLNLFVVLHEQNLSLQPHVLLWSCTIYFRVLMLVTLIVCAATVTLESILWPKGNNMCNIWLKTRYVALIIIAIKVLLRWQPKQWCLVVCSRSILFGPYLYVE